MKVFSLRVEYRVMNKGKTIYNEKLTFYKRIGSYRKPEDFTRNTKDVLDQFRVPAPWHSAVDMLSMGDPCPPPHGREL